MIDLTGPIVTTIRDNSAVAAITTRVRGGELAPGDTAPAVVVIRASNSRSPFGPGRGRLGLQQPRFYINCFAVSHIQASQLAGAVSDALHQLSARTISGKVIHQVMDEGWGGVVRDPPTGWATETVTVEVTGSA